MDVIAGNDKYVLPVEELAWYPNRAGTGKFAPRQLISSGLSHVWSIHAGDLDGDGDLDVLATSRLWGQGIGWHPNLLSSVVHGAWGGRR